ncbi:hypothetical protein [Robiginitalea sp. SC105]|uniref:hypothetical protein n=1 Tax=Robiginitalea sp. SC105 TaxID=2762332 RepID=UPI00351CAF74
MEKYFEATSTAAEERELREYFSGGDVAPHLEHHAPMFTFFSEAKNQRSTRKVPLKARRNYVRWVSVAAVAVLMLGLYFGNQYREQQKAEFAYQETRKALGLIAQNLDRGTQKVAHLSEFEETKQKIYKNN